jgi:hypothetical protein
MFLINIRDSAQEQILRRRIFRVLSYIFKIQPDETLSPDKLIEILTPILHAS